MRRLQLNLNYSSPTSSLREESLSPSLFDSEEFEFKNLNLSGLTNDELPIFAIRTISPSGRSLSPIDTDEFFSDELESPRFNMAVSPCLDDDDSEFSDGNSSTQYFEFEDVMTLDQLHEKIGTPPKTGKYNTSAHLNLETIFEGVLLETPTKESTRLIPILNNDT